MQLSRSRMLGQVAMIAGWTGGGAGGDQGAREVVDIAASSLFLAR
jgi:hypothetical protein